MYCVLRWCARAPGVDGGVCVCVCVCQMCRGDVCVLGVQIREGVESRRVVERWLVVESRRAGWLGILVERRLVVESLVWCAGVESRVPCAGCGVLCVECA